MLTQFFPLIGAVLGYILFKVIAKYLLQQITNSVKTQLPSIIHKWVTVQIFENEILLQQLASPEQTEKFKPALEEHIDHFLNVRLQEKVPALAMFIGPPTIASIKSGLMEEIDGLLPKLIHQLVQNAKTTLNIEQLINQQIEKKSDEAIAHIIRKPVQPYLSKFVLFGVLFGGILGTIFYTLTLI